MRHGTDPHFFTVQITADLGGGAYSFVEVWDQGAGSLVELISGRYAGAQNPAVDVLGVGFEVDDYALCRSASGRGGLTWELYPVGGSSTPTPGTSGTDDTNCAWLKWLPTSTCWTVYQRGGHGRCACFPTSDPTDPDAGVIATYIGALSGWLMVDPNHDEPTAMVRACCGCGSGLLQIDGEGVPKLTLGGVHVSCDAGAVLDEEELTDYVCGKLADGRYYILFFGSSEDVCDGAQQPCRNDYQILWVCGAECPPAGCGCEGCGASPTPVAWYALGVTGFSAAAWNGDWVWSQSSGCTWEAICDESTSTLTYVPGESPVWRLTHGGSVYEVAVSAGQCEAPLTLTRVSGSGSPTTLTLTPVEGSGTAPTCCSGCDIELLKSKTLYLTIAGVPEVLSATYDDVNDWWYFSGTVTGCTCSGALFEAFLECVGGVLLFSAIPLCPCKPTAKCAFGAYGEAGDYFLTVESCDPFFASGEQYLRLSCSSNPTTPVEFTLSEDPP